MSDKLPAAVELGRRGRAVNSEAQKQAARDNGKLGGRPKKSSAKPESPKRSARSVTQIIPTWSGEATGELGQRREISAR